VKLIPSISSSFTQKKGRDLVYILCIHYTEMLDTIKAGSFSTMGNLKFVPIIFLLDTNKFFIIITPL